MTPGQTFGRAVCYRCHKPRVTCLCQRIPRVENRTRICILQHMRERFHPIGSARIAQLGLDRVELSEWRPSSSNKPFELGSGAALLYPGLAPLLSEADAPPDTLVVLDGTWSHARNMLRDSPWLQELPRYGLQPAPSRYRIRREPAINCVSTIEAIAAALTLLEPDTPGVSGLLDAFEAMIDDQIKYARVHPVGRRSLKRSRRRSSPAIGDLPHERLVVVAIEGCASTRRDSRAVVRLTATRPATGAVFDRVLASGRHRVTDPHLHHMALSREHIAGGATLEQARRAWTDFVRPDDVVVAWHPSTLALLGEEFGHCAATMPLKRIYCNRRQGPSGLLAEVVAREALTPPTFSVPGRAGVLLGYACAVLALLRAPRAARA